MAYPTGLRTYQMAREVTKGLDLATTSKLAIPKLVLTPQDENYVPPLARGLLQRRRGFETVTKRWTKWSVDGPATFEQLQNFCEIAIVHVSAPMGTDPYVWTYTRNPAVKPTVGSATFERRETDGSSPVDHAVHYAMADEFELSGAPGEQVNMAMAGFARALQAETLTAGQSMPTPEIPVGGLSTLYIDDDFADVGTTPVSLQILGWRVKFYPGNVPIWTADGRSDLDYSLDSINGDNVYIEAEIMALLGSQYSTERTAARANTARAVRIGVVGSDGRELDVDFVGKYTQPEIAEFGEQDGQTVVNLKLSESSDGTNLFAVTLTNHIATFA